jgi:hypothetical protein
MELNIEMEIKALNFEIMSWFCFNHWNTLPYFLLKLSNLICLDVHTITIKVVFVHHQTDLIIFVENNKV